MVYVTHHGNNRRTRDEVVLVVLYLGDCLLHLSADIFGLESELLSHEVDGLGIQTLVDRHHDTYAHECSDHLVYRYVHHRSQFRNSHKLGQLQCLALLLLLATLLIHLFLSSLTLLLTILGTLLVLALLACESCKRLLYLACYVLVVHLSRLLLSASAILLLVLAASATVASGVGVLATLSARLVGSSIDVYAHLVDAFALLLVAALLLRLLLALLTLLFLRLLLGACALVERVEVDLAEYVHLRCVEHLLLALGGEQC